MHLTPVAHSLETSDRADHYGHSGGVLWMTGLSASGKTTLSMALEKSLTARGYSCYVLDGDNIRNGLNSDLGFTQEDRSENIRRVGEVASLFADAGLICISAFISPYHADRLRARQSCRQAFHEIYISTDLATCEKRDPKGLYLKARRGDLQEFTGVSSPYEEPKNAEMVINTNHDSVPVCLEKLISYVVQNFPLAKK